MTIYSDEMVEIYDLLYQKKAYIKECMFIQDIVGFNQLNGKIDCLDIACGTGRHISYLGNEWAVDGIDINRKMVELARRRNRNSEIVLEDMREFKGNKKYDLIICLFSSIGYLKSLEELRSTIECCVSALKPFGMMIIEPHYNPIESKYLQNNIYSFVEEDKKYKLVRVLKNVFERTTNSMEFTLTVLDKKTNKIWQIEEEHKLNMFSNDEFLSVCKQFKLNYNYLKNGIDFRKGIYLFTKNI